MKRKFKAIVWNFSNFITFQNRRIELRKILIPETTISEEAGSESSSKDSFSSNPISPYDFDKEISEEVGSESSSEDTFSSNPISPYEFDKEYYLKLYPDIAAGNIDPYFHFLNHGKAEGRRGSPYNLRRDVESFSETKETILVVSHDASRTGAPILALNITQELKKQFNVVILILNDGNITSFFEQTCNAIIGIDRSMLLDHVFIDHLVDHLIQQYGVKSSIVNSIESYCVLHPLAKRFIPTVLLIHEFAAYTRPHYKFMEAFQWAGTIVFSAKIVQKNAINIYTQNAMYLTQVLFQGKSNVPIEPSKLEQNHRIDNIINKNQKHRHSKPFIVLGAGSVHYRKGVDLFIATAAELKRSYSECNIKMLWVGSGYDPEHDISYSCYLAEQIERSGLTDSFELIDELSNLEELYQYIDLFYLSSRLDPLPNVAIDVMMLGKPLICFDKGTGIAEILEQDPNTSGCVLSHLSIIESTKKIIQFYQSPEYYSLISSKIKELANKHFNMSNYVTHLMSFFENQTKRAKQEELDCTTLENSIDFKEDFFLEPGFDRQDAIRRYVRSWHSKVNLFNLLRKPAPGFNQTIYDLYHSDRGNYIEPFADYIRSGKPVGPWQEKVISPNSNAPNSEKELRCAIHIHVFYSNLLKDIMDRIQMNESTFDVYISTNEFLFSQVSHVLSNYEQINSKLRVVPNKGRDIGPLLSEFYTELQEYDVIGHFHTKKSLDIQNAQFALDWFLFLIENLLGGQHRMADQIMNEFKNDAKLGLVFVDDPHLLDWGKNRPFANELANQLKLSNLPDHHFNFPVGTMFWTRPEAIKPLFELNYSWDMYPEEPLPYDGSVLHAMERLIPIIAANQGFSQVVTHIPGLTR